MTLENQQLFVENTSNGPRYAVTPPGMLCLLLKMAIPPINQGVENKCLYLESQVPCFFKAIVAGFRGKVALNNRTLGVPGIYMYI